MGCLVWLGFAGWLGLPCSSGPWDRCALLFSGAPRVCLVGDFCPYSSDDFSFGLAIEPVCEGVGVLASQEGDSSGSVRGGECPGVVCEFDVRFCWRLVDALNYSRDVWKVFFCEVEGSDGCLDCFL